MNALLTVSLPVFGLIFCGYLAGRFRVLGQESSEALNRFVYYFALPALFLIAVARSPIDEILNWPYLGVVLGGIAIPAAASIALSRWRYGDRLGAATMRATNAAFGNTGYMGIPLAITAFGEAGALPAVLYTVIASGTIISLATGFVAADARRDEGALAIAGDVVRNVLTSPLILPVVAGGVIAALSIELWPPVAAFLDLLGAAAAPCALFAIGLFMAAQPLRGELVEAGVISGLKLVLHPLATWALIAWVFPLEPLWAQVALLQAALPTGALAFVLGQRYGVFVARTSATILLSTAASVATVSLVLVLLGVS